MTVATWAMLAVLVPATVLLGLFQLGERMRRTGTIDQQEYRPTHKVNGDTRRLARPPRVNLTPEPGDTEWKFPPR